MVNFFSLVAVVSIAFAAQAGQERQLLKCEGMSSGVKVPVYVQVYVLNAKQVEGMKIQFKKQVLVNEVNRVEGQPYNDGLIQNHMMFKAQTDRDLALVLPVSFRMLKKTEAFLSQQKGDDINFTSLICSFQ